MLNTQAAIPQREVDPERIAVFKIFPTIQGEGPYTGRPATFIRLYGCNLQCPWCDTDYTSQLTNMTPDSIVESIKELNPLFRDYRFPNRGKPLVVITGGEPFRQNLSFLTRVLADYGADVQIETNGTLDCDGISAFRTLIVCSPKAPKVAPKIARFCKHYKYVLNAAEVDPEDGLPSITLGGMRPARPPVDFHGEIWVAPMDFTCGTEAKEQWAIDQANADNMRAAIASCMKFGYRLSVQTHKIANLE